MREKGIISAMESRRARPTIRDIARRAGVSTATVSYVLNDRDGVSDAVRERVRGIVRRMGYAPSLGAAGLKTRRSYRIHAVIRREAAPACKTFYFGVVACIAERLSPGRYSVVPVFQSDDESDRTLAEIVGGGGTDGVIAFQGVRPHVLAALKGRKIPYIIINPGFDTEPDAVSVRIDFEELAYRATSYLAALGHTDIAFIGMRSLPSFFSATKRGFRKALRERGLAVRRAWVRGEASCADGAAAAMRALLSEEVIAKAGGVPTAVFCAQDNFAISAMSVAAQAGYRVPKDISFVGLDDVPEARYLNPALTTIEISPDVLAEEALTRILAMTDGLSAQSVTIPSGAVVERGSAARPAGSSFAPRGKARGV
jgi:LacI family transcriptional regulator